MKLTNKSRRILIVSVVLFCVVSAIAGKKLLDSYSQKKEEYRFLSLFSEVAALVRNDYVEKVKPSDKFPGAFTGMLSSLDRYSGYLDNRQTKIYTLNQSNKVFISGIYGMRQAGYFYISDVDKDSPADQAGVKPGYYIRQINGNSIFGWSYWQMYLSLMSENKESIKLGLIRNNEMGKTEEPVEVQFETLPSREPEILKPVDSHVFLISLARITPQYIEPMIRQLKSLENTKSPISLIIDLRKYFDGDINTVITLSHLFFKKNGSLILQSKDKDEVLEIGSDSPLNYRAVVVVDKSTILYGELLANLFSLYREPGKVIIAGSKTPGFIAKMKSIPISDGSSILLLDGTFLLNGKNPDKSGIQPDEKLKEENSALFIERCISILNKTNG